MLDVGQDVDDYQMEAYGAQHSTEAMRVASGIFGDMGDFLGSGVYGDTSAVKGDVQAEEHAVAPVLKRPLIRLDVTVDQAEEKDMILSEDVPERLQARLRDAGEPGELDLMEVCLVFVHLKYRRFL